MVRRGHIVFAAAVMTMSFGAVAHGVDAPKPPPAPEPSKEALDFFENKIRPVLAERCYACHSAESKTLKGKLRLDTREGLLAGGESGKPAVVAGDPGASPLIAAIKWGDAKLRMPPKEEHRLTAEQVADFESWVKMGAPDPRNGVAAALAQVAPVDGKNHWAFQRPKDHPAPEV